MRLHTFILSAVSLVSTVALADDIRVSKYWKSGMTEGQSTLELKPGKECKLALGSALGKSEEKRIDAADCKGIASVIKKIPVKSARDESYVRKFCPESFETVTVGLKTKHYCIKGRRTDGKVLAPLNRYLGALSIKHFKVEF